MPVFDIKLFKRGDDAEQAFLLKLHIALGDEYAVSKTLSQYNTIDFIIKKNGVLFCYLELKSRTDLSGYSSLMIGRVKLERINEFLKPTLIVWVCEKTDTLYYIIYADYLLDIQTNSQNGSPIVYIPKRIVSLGFDELLDVINEL
jgi:hypothetical protein